MLLVVVALSAVRTLTLDIISTALHMAVDSLQRWSFVFIHISHLDRL